MSFAYVAHPRPRTPLFTAEDYHHQREFFRARPALAPTPLHHMSRLAASLGIAELRLKDETRRFGLNAFKAAGALFAVAILRERGVITQGETLVCASEGNHGRAVARAARDAGCKAHVYVAADLSSERIALIEGEGAKVERVPGTYDDAVRRMEEDARAHGWMMVSDTSTGGDTEIPRLIMLGYTRLMDEAEAAWSPGPPPDVIFVPAGVGGLLAAVGSWLSWRFGPARPRLVAVEPTSAACVLAAARAGHPVTLEGAFNTFMVGLRCREVSHAAFDAIVSCVDAYVAIDDRRVEEAVRQLEDRTANEPRIAAGASGAAALAGIMATVADPALADVKRALQIGQTTRAMVIVTEGVSGTVTAVPQADSSRS